MHVAKFAPNQKLPDGYQVVVFDGAEHYCWFKADSDEVGADHWDRFRARRDAWTHYKAQ